MKQFLLILFLFTAMYNQAATDTAGSLTVKFTTSATGATSCGGGKDYYGPSKNIVACWIVDSNGKFIKTLLAYASERIQWLVNWKSATSAVGSIYNTTDAVTAATRSTHASRSCTWNGKNYLGVDVADGIYTVKMECTDNHSCKSNIVSFNFTKGRTTSTPTTANTGGFSLITVSWEPNLTAIDKVTEESVKIYPDAEQKFLHIQGDGFLEANIYNILGKKLITTTEKKVSLQGLPSSTYFVILKFKDGYVSRKFVKR